MEQITSTQNNKIKLVNRLKKKKERDKTELTLIEGIYLIDKAFKSNIMIKQLSVIEPGRIDSRLLEYTKEAYEINMKVAGSLSGTITSQGFFVVIEKPKHDISKAKQVLLLDRIRDPGSLGTLIRTADTAGIDMVVVEKGTADAYQDKVMRASRGSVFHTPIVTTELNKFTEQSNGPVYGIVLENAVSYKDIESQGIFALLLDNEGEDVNKELLAHTSQNLIIPIYGKVESLNVAITGSILFYHLKG